MRLVHTGARRVSDEHRYALDGAATEGRLGLADPNGQAGAGTAEAGPPTCWDPLGPPSTTVASTSYVDRTTGDG